MNAISACFLLCLALGAGFATSARGDAATDLIRDVSPLVGQGDGGVNSLSVRFAQGVPVASGPYTASQAERGKVVYEQSCSTCHGSSLRGGANEFAAPALAGPFFYEKWSGRPLEELFRYAVDSMPPDQTRLSEAASGRDGLCSAGPEAPGGHHGFGRRLTGHETKHRGATVVLRIEKGSYPFFLWRASGKRGTTPFRDPLCNALYT